MEKGKTIAKEVKEAPEVEARPEGESIIGRVYLSKITGLEMLEGPEAEIEVKAIQKVSNGDDTDYTFYEDGMPIYIAIKNDRYEPILFPDPGPKVQEGQSGMTSMELYGLAVTLPSAVEKIIEGETEPKPSLLDQAKKVMTPTLVIIGAIIGTFLIVAMITG